MRIARIAALFALLVAGGGAARAEDLSGKLAELESGAKPPAGEVQIVPGIDQPQRTPVAVLEPEPDPPPAAAPEPEPMTDPDEDAELGDEPSGQSLGGGTGLAVEPKVQNTTEP
jgi:hypothetical protein